MRKINVPSSTTTWRVSSTISVPVGLIRINLGGRLLLVPSSVPLLFTLHFLHPFNFIKMNKLH
jgi:hypothetical protein